MRLLVLGGVCHQITFIVVESWLFAPLRERAAATSERFGKLLSCHLCFGTWVGFGLALAFRPRVARSSRWLPAPAQAVTEWAADAFAIALIGRAVNELLGFARREVEVKQKQAELVGELAEQERQRLG